MPRAHVEDIGDLLLTFGVGAAVPRGRTHADWSTVFDDRAMKLQFQAPAKMWRGFPLSTAEVGAWRLWLIGELYDCDPSDVSRRLIAVATGERAADSLDGHFLLLGYDRRDQRWHVWTDRFGTLHVYVARSTGRVAVGTHLDDVARAASARQLDWRALTSWFSCGFFIGDRTFFSDTTIVRPATHLVLDERGSALASERYWSWRYRPDHKLAPEDAADELANALSRVMHEHAVAGRLAMPISGGLDSRTTVAFLNGSRAKVWPYSYGYSDDSPEVRIAARVAAARGLVLSRFVIEPYLFSRLDNILASVEGFQDITQCRQAAVSHQLAVNADRVVAAHWGDVWFDDMGLVNAPSDLREDTLVDYALHKVQKTGRKWLLDHVCASRLGNANPEALVRDEVAAGVAATRDLDEPDFRIKAFKTDQWSFRWTLASLRMFQTSAYPRLPFYDTRVTDVFARVPSALLRERRLQVLLLKRHAPDLAAVPWELYDANLYRYRYFNSLLVPKRIARKMLRVLARRRHVQRNWEVQFAERASLAAALLRPGLRLHEFVSPEHVRLLLEDRYNTGSAAAWGYAVSMLLTFSAWLERSG